MPVRKAFPRSVFTRVPQLRQRQAYHLPKIMESTVPHRLYRGYFERHKIVAVPVEGQFVEVLFWPQTVGGGAR